MRGVNNVQLVVRGHRVARLCERCVFITLQKQIQHYAEFMSRNVCAIILRYILNGLRKD